MREWLREARISAGMSEKRVAEGAGISQPVYHRIESGQSNPRAQTAQAIGRVLGIGWERFFEDEGGETE